MPVQVDLTGPAGRIEALLEGPEDARFLALVCHPHPRFGGTMHNHATYRLAKAVRAAGGRSLRFNYRGVGRSAGAYDGGRGEADDARAALEALEATHPGAPLLVCGFSFGAWMAVKAGSARPGVAGLLLAGLALRSADADLDAARDAADVRAVRRPLAVVQAERDEFGTPAEVAAALAGSAGPRRLTPLPGATHLCGEDLPGLQREAEASIAWLLEQGGVA
ncbi:MAG: alpha/beta hydrolase [Anaeromyxobacter sp.]